MLKIIALLLKPHYCFFQSKPVGMHANAAELTVNEREN